MTEVCGRLAVDTDKKIHEQITEESWERGTSTDKGKLCIALWCMRRYGFQGCEQPLRKIAEILGFASFKSADIMAWNDSPDRTFGEVLKVLKEADV